MYALDDVRELHIELTEKCNAQCPMCGRRDQGGTLNPHLAERELRVKDFRKFFPPSFLKQLVSLRLCGNFGDPAAARDTIAICEIARTSNPRISLRMNSNGSIRSREWWFQLGRLFRGQHDSVQFGIDGLEDTHSLYRRGTSISTILRNADSFIRGGGNAHWVFLVFEHNEHQISAAESRARALGFSQFTVKATKRFLSAKQLSVSKAVAVRDTDGEELYQLRLPTDRALWNETLLRVEQAGHSIEAALDRTPISCKAVTRRSLFVSAGGIVFPCCWLGGARFPLQRGAQSVQLERVIDAVGGVDGLSLQRKTLDEIFASGFFELVEESWSRTSVTEGRMQVCARVCGKEIEAFEKQFVKDTPLETRSSVLELC